MSLPLAGAHGSAGFASTPPPPYFAVIFTSRRTDVDAGYDEAATAMARLAAAQPGFLGVESARGSDGVGITVSYWASEQAIAAWRRHAEHVAVREQGRSQWYEHFEVRIARVERAYAGPTQENR
ncbi:antibiotic biosynthesis monooxygenase family protein [Lysobacter korlensis]|uniref:Antibiotic biosynthesis monooxygenase family protein n=1 Tax=Lysobacter korlensis TaxID=553636 RepID=A0ABV6RJ91_9GAMM